MADPATASTSDASGGARVARELRIWQRFHVRLAALYGLFLLAILCAVAALVYRHGVEAEMRGLRGRLRTLTTVLAAEIDARALAALPEDARDTPLQRDLAKAFERIARTERDLNCVYVLRPTRERGVFTIFVEWAADGDPMRPGETYDARAVPSLLRGLEGSSIETEPTADRFGLTLSGSAPLLTPSGEAAGLVGCDVDASEIAALKRRVVGFAAALFGGAAALLGLATYLAGRSVRGPLARIIEVAEAVAAGRFETRAGLDRTDEFGLVGRHLDRMAQGLAEREFIRETFGRFVSADVAANLLSSQDAPRLGGEARNVSVLFSDLRGYSTLSERLTPTEVVDALNMYLGAMNEVIDSHKGCVIELLGDAIVAVFNAPNRLDDHEAQAVRCALAMRERLGALNAEWEASGLARKWQERGVECMAARFGLHAGPVIAGNLGGKTRMKYAVIGDSVNLAARLEQMNKDLGTDMLLSGALLARLPPDLASRAVSRGAQRVKGREEAVEVYSI